MSLLRPLVHVTPRCNVDNEDHPLGIKNLEEHTKLANSHPPHTGPATERDRKVRIERFFGEKFEPAVETPRLRFTLASNVAGCTPRILDLKGHAPLRSAPQLVG